MFKRLRRERNLLSILLAGTIIISLYAPVMGEETAAIEDLDTPIPMDVGDYNSGVEEQGEVIQDSAFEIASDDGNFLQERNDSLYHGFNRSESANNYCGIIFVQDKGLFDAPVGGEELKINGVSYDPETYTLTLSNANIGSVFDDTLSHAKKGAIVFCGSNIKDGTDEYGFPNNHLPDYKIRLIGHNYLGGYSTYERKHAFWSPYFIQTESGNSYCIYGALQNASDGDLMDHKIQGGSRSVIIEGDGDLTINGPISISMDTADKTLWFSQDEEGKNILSADRVLRDKYLKEEFGGVPSGSEAWHSYFATVFNEDSHGTNNQIASRGLSMGMFPDHLYEVGYMQIGGSKPETADITEIKDPMKKTTVSLGEIGGHSVSVCFTDNIPYDGRKLIQEDNGYGYYRASGSESRAADITVYIDNVPYYTYDSHLRKGMETSDEFKENSVVVKFMNNKDVTTVKGGKTLSPCFSFSFTKKSGLDDTFIKALKDYFKDKDNWIMFTILPQDIKYAELTFLGTKKYRKKPLSSTKRKKTIQKNIRLNGETIKKISLYGPRLTTVNDRAREGGLSKPLKWDKKYSGGAPAPGTDFRAEISGNYIVITGQNNYTGTVIINNPMIKDDDYYYQPLSSYSGYDKFFTGTMYDYRKPSYD